MTLAIGAHDTTADYIASQDDGRRPVRRALFYAGIYLLLASSYILLSTWLAGLLSESVQQLQYFELFKGLAFVAVTSLLLFGLCLSLLHRIQRHEVQIARQIDALNKSERAMLTGMFAGAIAHDINNALSVAQLTVDQLRQHVAPDSREDRLAGEITSALNNIAAWNQRTFEIGFKRVAQDKALLDLRDLVVNTAKLAQRHESLRDCQIELDVPATGVSYLGNANLIRRSLLNLLLNAGQAAGPRGRIKVAVHTGPKAEVILCVDDDGPGIPAEDRAKVVEPFYTTRADGTGIGLASVQSCANFHNGRLEIDTSEWGGARVQLRLARMTA